MVPGRIGQRSRRREVDADAESRAQGEQERGDEEQGELCPVAALAEFFGPLQSWCEDREQGDGDGQKG